MQYVLETEIFAQNLLYIMVKVLESDVKIMMENVMTGTNVQIFEKKANLEGFHEKLAEMKLQISDQVREDMKNCIPFYLEGYGHCEWQTFCLNESLFQELCEYYYDIDLKETLCSFARATVDFPDNYKVYQKFNFAYHNSYMNT